MSFIDFQDEIKEGDLVLAWMTRTSIKPITIQSGSVLNTRYGAFPHNQMIGKKFGSQMPSTSSQGFIHLMAPTPELWTLSLPHRTQIVYTPDSSYIVQRLKIRPGSRVIEAGTGSGSFTHALARTVGKKGQVFSFEFHEARYHDAKKEIEDHGLDEVVKINHRDVCLDGFNIANENVNATAVFLDLPAPWTAIPHLNKIVSCEQSVSICCFSPCIEQVTKTIDALKKTGFQRIEMVEVNAARWESRKSMVKTAEEALDRLRDVKKRRAEGMEKRHERIKQAKRVRDEESEEQEQHSESSQSSNNHHTGKKGYNPWGKGFKIKEGDENYEWRDVSRIEAEVKSHTSYLTFATLPPPFPERLSNDV